MTCPRCKCPECAKVELNAVLVKHVSRETTYQNAPSVELDNARALQVMQAKDDWRDAFMPDPDAEQLARDVLDCAAQVSEFVDQRNVPLEFRSIA